MSTLMILIDGIENDEYFVCSSLNGIAPFGEWNNSPEGMDTDSLNCIMTILGVEPSAIPSGRAYLEALALGVPVSGNDLVFRCNHVDIDAKGVLVSSYKEGTVNNVSNNTFELRHIGKHKYLLIAKNAADMADKVVTYPPHQNVGKALADIMPRAEGWLGAALRDMVNNLNIFPWGQAVRQNTPTFFEIHGKNGAIVAKTEIVAGMAKAMDMHCPVLLRATADVDTDLDEKARRAIELCGIYDFVLLHINGTDESAHRGDKEEKLRFITDIDKHIINTVLRDAPPTLGVIITADHETSSETGRHINSAVKYYCLNNIEECSRWLKR